MQLVGLINKLHRDVRADIPSLDGQSVLHQLKEYGQARFPVESDVMRRLRFPQSMRHEDEHGRFLAQLRIFELEMTDQNERELMTRILDFLQQWYLSHILGGDAQLRNHYRQHINPSV